MLSERGAAAPQRPAGGQAPRLGCSPATGLREAAAQLPGGPGGLSSGSSAAARCVPSSVLSTSQTVNEVRKVWPLPAGPRASSARDKPLRAGLTRLFHCGECEVLEGHPWGALAQRLLCHSTRATRLTSASVPHAQSGVSTRTLLYRWLCQGYMVTCVGSTDTQEAPGHLGLEPGNGESGSRRREEALRGRVFYRSGQWGVGSQSREGCREEGCLLRGWGKNRSALSEWV